MDVGELVDVYQQSTKVWMSVMDFLPYQDLLHCCAINRFFLSQIMPLIRSLEISDPCELHIAPLGRFSQVTDVTITCLVKVEELGDGHELCKVTADRLIHFLSHFPNLERAWAGGVDNLNYTWKNYFTYDVNLCLTDGHEEVFRGLIRSLCGGYRAGVLNRGVYVDGIISGGNEEENQAMFVCNPEVASEGGECDLCSAICSSIPLDWAMKLRQKVEMAEEEEDQDWVNSRGSVCLTTKDRLSIIERRPGGAEFLASPSAISCCISAQDTRDRRNFRINKRGKPSLKGRYNAMAIDVSAEIMQELEMVLSYGFNPRQFKYEDIVQDYWRSLEGEVPSRGCCYMTRRTYNAFVKFGFSIKESDFFLVDSDDCIGWQEGLPIPVHPDSGWTFIVPIALKHR